MSRVLPSEVVANLDQMTSGWNLDRTMLLDQGHLGTVATVVGLAEQVPAELLVHAGARTTQASLPL